MAARKVKGPPFPTIPLPWPHARKRAAITIPADYTPCEQLGWEHYQHTSRFLELPFDLRRNILRQAVVTSGEIGVNIRQFYPSRSLERGWLDDMVALRCTCKQLSYETAEVFVNYNHFVFEDIVDARYLGSWASSAVPRVWANMRNLRLGAYFIVPYSCSTTQIPQMDVCHGDFLIAMEPFWGVRRLKMTLPWDLKLPEWKYLIGTVHLAFPHLIEFKIDRPDVKWLLPDAVANHVPFYLAENSYTGFWGSVTTNHPMGFEYPTKIAQILEETQREIGWLNNFYMPLGKTEVKFTKALELITDIWRDSPNSFAPSPGYDSKTKLLVGGEERRRMFPQHYRNDPPAQQSTQQPTQVQPDQPNNQPNNQPDNQPYHFQQ